MNVILFGATGMIGQGVLREALRAPDVARVLAVVRNTTGVSDPKLQELVHHDFTDFSDVEAQLGGFDACFYCLGVSAAGMSEADYRHITYDFTLAAATTLARASPGMTFIYISGAGTDSSGKGRSMWARVKGQTENALSRLPFHAVHMFRPGYIHPAHGERSKTAAYRIFYSATGWLFPLLRRILPSYVTTTEVLARAMLRVAREGASQRILENRDIAGYGGGLSGS